MIDVVTHAAVMQPAQGWMRRQCVAHDSRGESKIPARRSGRAHFVSFNIVNTLIETSLSMQRAAIALTSQ
jgi:hypothetical protein